nr:integrase, catalytic region, zinc finger, CCHC-type, peptidase aspartic, catalytic [Tanacetum cinerariifolium]
MTSLADKAILSGVDNRPPMLEKDMYASWKSIMELYILNRQHGRTILEFVENGPLLWPTVEKNRVTRPKKYSELSATEAIQADCDVVQIVLWYLEFGCSKHMTGDRSQLINFVQKFLGTVNFGNDHFAKIMGYGDYKIGNVTISRVYFVEGLWHNLFSGQFCDSDLEIDHLCYACAMGKSKKKSHKPKSEDTNQEKLYLLHMDLCGPMRVESVNGKKYILVIVDDYSRFIWVKCLRSKDEALDFIIKFLKMIQVRIKVPRLWLSYAPTKKAFQIYNRRTRRIVETIHVDFDELAAMASKQSSSGPALNEMTPATLSSELVQKPSSSTPYVPP